MKQTLKSIIENLMTVDVIPFFLVAKGTGKPTLNPARVIEGVVIAVLAGVISGIMASYIAVIRLDEKYNALKEDLIHVREDVAEIRGNVTAHIDRDR